MPASVDEGDRSLVRDLLDLGIASGVPERRRPRDALAPQRLRRVARHDEILVGAEWTRQRRGVGRCRAGDGIDVARRVAHRTADRTGHRHQRVVERPVGTDPPEGHLETEESRVRRGDSDRAAAVAPRADRHHSRRDCRRRTARTIRPVSVRCAKDCGWCRASTNGSSSSIRIRATWSGRRALRPRRAGVPPRCRRGSRCRPGTAATRGCRETRRPPRALSHRSARPPRSRGLLRRDLLIDRGRALPSAVAIDEAKGVEVGVEAHRCGRGSARGRRPMTAHGRECCSRAPTRPVATVGHVAS